MNLYREPISASVRRLGKHGLPGGSALSKIRLSERTEAAVIYADLTSISI